MVESVCRLAHGRDRVKETLLAALAGIALYLVSLWIARRYSILVLFGVVVLVAAIL